MVLNRFSNFMVLKRFFSLLGCTGVTGEKKHGIIEFVGLLDVVVPR